MTAVATDLEVDAALHRLLATAAEMTGARYAAVGVLDARRAELERFVTHGVSDAVRQEIGPPPKGHPTMETFLRVPVLVRGEAWGNLYLCDKADGEPFSSADEESVVMLAGWAGIAIDNARNCENSERRREELERTVRQLEATTAIARAVGGETDLDRILELIVDSGQALIEADGLVILLRELGGMVIAAEAGAVPCQIRDPLGLSAAGGLLVPLVFRGESLGMLVVFGERGGAEHESLLQAFAASAATAVATARRVEESRLREAILAAEKERQRWARELHDDTLQGLGGLRMLLVAASRSDDHERLRSAVQDTLGRIDEEIDGLRGLIRELRPAALDELGLAAAIEGLATRAADRGPISVSADVRLRRTRYSPELETGIYRIVQEALTNATRHADAAGVKITVEESAHAIYVHVSDDGHGFDPAATDSGGFGLTGMRERVSLLRGDLEISASAGGTTIAAAIPIL